MVSNYSPGISQQAGPSPSFAPPPSALQMVNALIIMSRDEVGQPVELQLFAQLRDQTQT